MTQFDRLIHCLIEDPTYSMDVAEAALYFAQDEYPELNVEEYLAQIDELAESLRPRLVGTLAEKMDILCHFLFQEEGYQGNEASYYDPQNSYFNQVMDRKLGIPITLSILAMSIGQRVGLEIAGLALPGHFIAKATEADEAILFDPYHRGKVLTLRNCEELISRVSGYPFHMTRECLRATPLSVILLRMLNNLKNIYLQMIDLSRATRIIARIILLTPEDWIQHRDLGVIHFQQKRYGMAIDPLKTYLTAHPEANDSGQISLVLQEAYRQVARWN